MGTFNAPNLWRFVDMEWPGLGGPVAPGASGVRLRIGTAAQRMEVPVRRSTSDGERIVLEADWAGAQLALVGTVTGDHVEGTLRAFRGDQTLSEGGWRMDRCRTLAMTPQEVLDRLRESLGVMNITGGLTLGDAPAESNAAEPEVVHHFGSDGEVSVAQRGSVSLVHADDRFWMVRPPAGRSIPDARMTEKLLLPEWVRSAEYVRHPDRFVYEVWERGEGETRRIVLMFWTRKHGVVPVSVSIDPVRWLPDRAQIEWDAGPRVLALTLYESVQGFLVPRKVVESYRGKDTALSVVTARVEAVSKDRFDAPPVPWVVEYDVKHGPIVAGTHGAGDEGHLFVRPLVHGRDLGWFHVDSGAPFLVLDTKVADELGLAIVREMGDATLRTVNEIRLGQLVLRDLTVMARDLSSSSAPPHASRSGVLGGPLFESAIVEFDYRGAALGVFAPAAYDASRRTWEPLGLAAGPIVQARFEGDRTGRFLLDTGKSGTVSFFSETARAAGLLDGRPVTETINSTVVGETIELSATLAWFELGGRRFENPIVQCKVPGTPNDDVVGVLGYVGRGFFGDRLVVLDYQRGRIAFVDR